ncbi:hypothetical protein Taro_050712 [Colocasia esculenta]|uniref:Uncharacterized protein n=1 Tax=Colocasia esculenta TaxID=4460 RepID=A0A843XEH8_COLES|nr:hypothetical protein [Colocasia esculenta]
MVMKDVACRSAWAQGVDRLGHRISDELVTRLADAAWLGTRLIRDLPRRSLAAPGTRRKVTKASLKDALLPSAAAGCVISALTRDANFAHGR